MNQAPLVSILIPTHRANLLKHSLASAVSQTYSNTEIIISDNSESDDIWQMCQSYPNVRYYRNPRPTKTDFWMNVENPLQYAKGTFIKYLFDDDLLFPNCIDTMIGQLNRLDSKVAERVALVFSSRHVFDDNGITYDRWAVNSEKHPCLMSGPNLIRTILMNCSNPVGELSTVLFRNPYNENWRDKDLFRYGNVTAEFGLIDVAMYLRLLETDDALYLPFDLSAFRLHENGASNPSTNPLFVNAVTDWFFLMREAYLRGILDNDSAFQAVSYYITVAQRFDSLYPIRISEVHQEALSLLKTISNVRN
jgi:glycosyltransferase involved in cell wall biosynthesis